MPTVPGHAVEAVERGPVVGCLTDPAGELRSNG